MCYRYYVYPREMDGDIQRTMDEINRRGLNRREGPDIRPTDYAPVITASGVCAMQWGFLLPGIKSPVVNARSETASVKPLFAESVRRRRCIIPASGYYEWDARKNQYTISDLQPLALAGFFREDERFCILTQSPIPALSAIHSRMPVVLTPQAADAYLRGELQPHDAQPFVPPGLAGRTDAIQLSLFD